MSRVKPIAREHLPEFEPLFEQFESMGGFVPNSLLTMAHRPGILQGYMALGQGVMMSGTIDPKLKRLVALVSSTASGCRYCQAHMTVFSGLTGMDEESLAAVWEFEFDERFNEAERAALRLAQAAGVVPNAVTDAHFKELRRHYSDAEIVELVGVIAMFGFLNRWNDTMATTLEQAPREYAERSLGELGWQPGKHAPDQPSDD